MSAHKGWIGVDLDGTLAHYEGWVHHQHIGAPVPAMLERVKAWLAEGREVRIMTARVYPFTVVVTEEELVKRFSPNIADYNVLDDRQVAAAAAANAISRWCKEHLGCHVPITCVKDYAMIELWDDRAVQVRPNTGEPVGHATRPQLERMPGSDQEVNDLLNSPAAMRAFLGVVLELYHGGQLSLPLDRIVESHVARGNHVLHLESRPDFNDYKFTNKLKD